MTDCDAGSEANCGGAEAIMHPAWYSASELPTVTFTYEAQDKSRGDIVP